jgi:hypothetical protein
VSHIAEKRKGYRFAVGNLAGNKHLYGISAYWMGITNGC